MITSVTLGAALVKSSKRWGFYSVDQKRSFEFMHAFVEARSPTYR